MFSTENKNAYYGSIPTSEAETEAEPLKAMVRRLSDYLQYCSRIRCLKLVYYFQHLRILPLKTKHSYRYSTFSFHHVNPIGNGGRHCSCYFARRIQIHRCIRRNSIFCHRRKCFSFGDMNHIIILSLFPLTLQQHFLTIFILICLEFLKCKLVLHVLAGRRLRARANSHCAIQPECQHYFSRGMER